MARRVPVVRRGSRFLAALVAGLLFVVVLGGSTNQAEGEPPPVRLYDVETLIFEPPELKRRFQTFDAVARRFCADGFTHQPYRVGGGSVYAGWMKGGEFRSQYVFPGGTPPAEDLHEVTLRTDVLPPPLGEGEVVGPSRPEPRARSELVAVTFIARDPERWCVSWGYDEKPSRFGGTYGAWSVRFFRWDASRLKRVLPFRPFEEVTEQIDLTLHGYAVADQTVPFPRRAPDEFFHRLKSAAAMRDAYLADLDRLEADVVRFLDEKRATKFFATEKAEGNRPPQGMQVPLTVEEEAAERTKAQGYFGARRLWMEEHHQAMYAAFRQSFPIEQCWPERFAE